MGFKWSDSLGTAALDDSQLPPPGGGGIYLQTLDGRFFSSGSPPRSWGRAHASSGGVTASG